MHTHHFLEIPLNEWKVSAISEFRGNIKLYTAHIHIIDAAIVYVHCVTTVMRCVVTIHFSSSLSSLDS